MNRKLYLSTATLIFSALLSTGNVRAESAHLTPRAGARKNAQRQCRRAPTPKARVRCRKLQRIGNKAAGTPSNTSAPSAGTRAPNLPPVPSLALWETHMLQYGKTHCSALQDAGRSFDEKLRDTYYDAEWVYYQIADYTHDPSWNTCAAAAEAVYRDNYVLKYNGAVPGYWIFSHGLLEDYMRTDDAQSRNALVQLAHNAAFAADTTPMSSTASVDQSRETAYVIMAYLNAELVGEPRRERLGALVDQALTQMQQWFAGGSVPYIRPFMVALTSHALISYQEQVGGRDMLPVLQTAADWLWDNTWLPEARAFKYTDRTVESGGTEPAPDLNLLIAPLYAWVYHQTGDDRYRDRADQIFAGGVEQAAVHIGKQFNQNYRWSFSYLKWRNEKPLR